MQKQGLSSFHLEKRRPFFQKSANAERKTQTEKASKNKKNRHREIPFWEAMYHHGNASYMKPIYTTTVGLMWLHFFFYQAVTRLNQSRRRRGGLVGKIPGGGVRARLPV